MRITADEKLANRARILDAAKELFRGESFDQATIRDIAAAAGLATGTLFNYFASKEEIAAALTHEAASRARKTFLAKRRPGAPLAEDLFLHIATQLRALKPLRRLLRPVVDASLALTATGNDTARASHELRAEHLEAVSSILRDHGVDADRWATTIPIYWSLYVGVLSHWSSDSSPKQEATLAMLDQAVNMYVAWLQAGE